MSSAWTVEIAPVSLLTKEHIFQRTRCISEVRSTAMNRKIRSFLYNSNIRNSEKEG